MKDTKLWAINQHFPMFSLESWNNVCVIGYDRANVSRGTIHILMRNKI